MPCGVFLFIMHRANRHARGAGIREEDIELQREASVPCGKKYYAKVIKLWMKNQEY